MYALTTKVYLGDIGSREVTLFGRVDQDGRYLRATVTSVQLELGQARILEIVSLLNPGALIDLEEVLKHEHQAVSDRKELDPEDWFREEAL